MCKNLFHKRPIQNYLFAVIADGHENEGEEFLVGAYSEVEAWKIAEENFGVGCCACYGTLTDAEAEASGLDEF